MKSSGSPATPPMKMEEQLREMNEALLISSVRQHELTEQAQQAEAAMRLIERELSDFFETASVGLHRVGGDGVILQVNQAELDLLGYRREEYVGHHIEEFHVDQPVIEDILARLRRGESVRDYPARLRSKDGSIRDVLINSSALFEKGEFIHTRSFTHDITERKHAQDALRESEERFRAMADNISQLAWMCDALGNVTWYNQRWLDYTGMTFEEMKGWDWQKVQHPDHVDRVVKRVQRSAESGEMWEDTFPLRGKDGNYRWFLSRAVPIRDEHGKVIRWFGTNTDVTEREQYERERERLLGSEQKARREADDANRLKDEFLATVSHELRTPLNAIMGWAHMLIRGKLDEETSARGLETIARNAKIQTQLISDLLDVSRIISGQVRFESGVVDLIPVIESATETVRPAADAKGVILQLRLDPAAGMVSGDSIRLQQIVWNLLTNAVKFTSRDGHVEVQLKRQDTSVAIIVSDTGEGISAEFVPYIFDRFRQAESTTKRQHGGLGLGLSIVRHLVEAHGGTIRAASKGDGLGADFTVTLPMIAVSRAGSGVDGAGKQSADHASSTLLTGLRVLVIDDEADARELLIIALTQSGADVRAAATVRAGLDLLEQWKPDVLVSDIGMPGEDGYDLIRKVRALKSERGGTIPALALTGYASPEDAMRARDAGFQTHMAKPVAPSDLVASVAALAESSVKVKST